MHAVHAGSNAAGEEDSRLGQNFLSHAPSKQGLVLLNAASSVRGHGLPIQSDAKHSSPRTKVDKVCLKCRHLLSRSTCRLTPSQRKPCWVMAQSQFQSAEHASFDVQLVDGPSCPTSHSTKLNSFSGTAGTEQTSVFTDQ